MENEAEVAALSRSHSTLDERTVYALEDDPLAAQEHGRVFGRGVLSPETELMAAVLDEAISDYRRYVIADGKRSRKRFSEVEAWVLKEDYKWIFSFVNCCEALGIDPSHVRAGLRRSKQRLAPMLSTPPLIRARTKIARKLFHQAA